MIPPTEAQKAMFFHTVRYNPTLFLGGMLCMNNKLSMTSSELNALLKDRVFMHLDVEAGIIQVTCWTHSGARMVRHTLVARLGTPEGETECRWTMIEHHRKREEFTSKPVETIVFSANLDMMEHIPTSEA